MSLAAFRLECAASSDPELDALYRDLKRRFGKVQLERWTDSEGRTLFALNGRTFRSFDELDALLVEDARWEEKYA